MSFECMALCVKRSQRERYREVLCDAARRSPKPPAAARALPHYVRDGFQYQIEFRGSLIFNLLGSTLIVYHRHTGDPTIVNLPKISRRTLVHNFS